MYITQSGINVNMILLRNSVYLAVVYGDVITVNVAIE